MYASTLPMAAMSTGTSFSVTGAVTTGTATAFAAAAGGRGRRAAAAGGHDRHDQSETKDDGSATDDGTSGDKERTLRHEWTPAGKFSLCGGSRTSQGYGLVNAAIYGRLVI